MVGLFEGDEHFVHSRGEIGAGDDSVEGRDESSGFVGFEPREERPDDAFRARSTLCGRCRESRGEEFPDGTGGEGVFPEVEEVDRFLTVLRALLLRFGPELGMAQRYHPRIIARVPVDGPGAEAHDEPHHADVAPDLRMPAERILAEGHPRECGEVEVAVRLAHDALDDTAILSS